MRTGVVPCALAAGALAAQPADSPPDQVTIAQAVQEAVDHNLNLLAERYNLSVADARDRDRETAAESGVQRGPGLHRFPASVQPPTTQAARRSTTCAPISCWSAAASASGGSKWRRDAREVAQLQLLNTTRTLVLDVQNAFVDVLQAKDNLALARENLQAFQNIVDVNATRVRAGDLAKVELVRTQVAALQFQSAVRQAESKLRIAANKLQRLMGRAAPSPTFDVEGDAAPRYRRRWCWRRSTTQALELRPDLLALRRDQARSQAEICDRSWRREKWTSRSGRSITASFTTGTPTRWASSSRRRCRCSTGTRARSSARGRNSSRFWRASAPPRADVQNEVRNAWMQYTTSREPAGEHRARAAGTGARRARHDGVLVPARRGFAGGISGCAARLQRRAAEPQRRARGLRAEPVHDRRDLGKGSPMRTDRGLIMSALLLCRRLLLRLAGCGKKEEAAAAAAATAAPQAKQRLPDGTVVIPADSPKLKEIHVAEVKTRLGAVRRGDSPGKIEANPNLVSRVALPLAGRVSRVLVKLGDAVKRGEPLLTWNRRTRTRRSRAYLQAQAALTQAKANLNKAQADYDRVGRSVRAQRGREEGRADRGERAGAGQGGGGTGAGGAASRPTASCRCSGSSRARSARR